MKNNEFLKILRPIHKNHTKRIYKKLLRKIYNLKQNLKTRSRENDVEYTITINQLKKLIYQAYGKKCRYCDRKVTVHNMTCDHIIPITENGGSVIDNLQIICKTCNTSKANLSHKEFKKLLDYLNKQPDRVREYVLSKLRRGSNY